MPISGFGLLSCEGEADASVGASVDGEYRGTLWDLSTGEGDDTMSDETSRDAGECDGIDDVCLVWEGGREG